MTTRCESKLKKVNRGNCHCNCIKYSKVMQVFLANRPGMIGVGVIWSIFSAVLYSVIVYLGIGTAHDILKVGVMHVFEHILCTFYMCTYIHMHE